MFVIKRKRISEGVMKTIQQRQVRDGGIELFRCLLMATIVFHHCCVNGPFSKEIPTMLFFVLTIPAVDGFVAISGWYGIKFTLKRFFRLWGVVAFYTMFIYFLSLCMRRFGFPVKVEFNVTSEWFAGSYLALMFVAPFINAGVEALSSEKKSCYPCGGFTLLLSHWIGCRDIFLLLLKLRDGAVFRLIHCFLFI